MLNLSNLLSLSRALFALAFFQQNGSIRFLAVCLAMISDFLDGYIARKQKTSSQFGAILDPLMDKFFVFFAGGVFFLEGNLETFQCIAFFSRDIALCLFGIFLGLIGHWKTYEIRSIYWGKISTASQFLLLLGLSIGISLPTYIYWSFFIMSLSALFELFFRHRLRS